MGYILSILSVSNYTDGAAQVRSGKFDISEVSTWRRCELVGSDGGGDVGEIAEI